MDGQKVLHLVPGCRENLGGNLVAYDLMTCDCHHDNFELFYPLFVEIAEQVLVNCVPLSIHGYTRKKDSKKRWLLPDRPAAFFPNPDVDRITDYIRSNKLGWQSCTIAYTEKRGWFHYDEKRFFVSAPNADEHFIRQNFNPNLGVLLIGYLPEHFMGTDSVACMAKDAICQNKSRAAHDAVSVFINGSQTKLDIVLNPFQYPVMQLINRIRVICEKHDKEFEVNL